MSSYVWIDEEAYMLDTDAEMAEARKAMLDADVTESRVYVGLPDGLGDSYANGEVLLSYSDDLDALDDGDVQELRVATGLEAEPDADMGQIRDQARGRVRRLMWAYGSAALVLEIWTERKGEE